MALVDGDGFDHYLAANAALFGWSGNFTSNQSPANGSGQAVRLASAANRTRTLPSTYTTLIMGGRVRFSGTPGAADVFFRFRVGVTDIAILQLTTGNKLQVTNAAGTVIATGTTTILANTWYYIELKVVVNGASGSCEVHLGGATEIAATTGNFGSTAIDTIMLQSVSAGAINIDFDDLYLADTTGAAPYNTFFGDVACETEYANGDGSNSQWTPDTGTAHFSRVNETTPDGDTSYVADGTVGHKDTYQFGDLSISSGTIFGVIVAAYARKDDATARQICPVIRQGGTDYDGTSKSVPSSYSYLSQVYALDPTGAAWTISNFNADEFGIKVTV